MAGREEASRARMWTTSSSDPGWIKARAGGRRAMVWSAAVSRISEPWLAARRARCSALSRSTRAMRAWAAVMSASAASMREANAAAAALARAASPVARCASRSSNSERRRATAASCRAWARVGPPGAWATAQPPPSSAARRKGRRMRCILLSFPVIGVVGKDRGSAPELLGQHCAGEEMGPGGAAEGQEQVGTGAVRVRKAVGAADQEAGLAAALVAPAFQTPGQLERAERLAFLVEKDGDHGFGGRRSATAAFGQFRDLGRPGDTFQIALDQLGLRAPADLAAGDDVETQRLESVLEISNHLLPGESRGPAAQTGRL